MYLKYCIYAEIGCDDPEEFGEWAFGKEYRTIEGQEFMHQWNLLHGDIYELRPDGNVRNDIVNMIKLWREKKIDFV